MRAKTFIGNNIYLISLEIFFQNTASSKKIHISFMPSTEIQ